MIVLGAPTFAQRWSLDRLVLGTTLLAIAPLLVFTVYVLAYIGNAPMLPADAAVLELWTRSAIDGEAFLGPYSRFGWNHPGPLLFYVLAPLYWVTGERVGGLGLAAALLAIVGLGAIVLIVHRIEGALGAWSACAAVLLFVRATGTHWFDEFWNPVVVIVPIAVLGVTAAAVVAGLPWFLVASTIVASFAVQTHVGAAPVVAVLVAVALIGVGRGVRSDWPRWRRPVLLAAGFAVALWLLPLFQEATADPGNLARLGKFAVESHGDHALGDVIDQTAGQVSLAGGNLIHTAIADALGDGTGTGQRLAMVLVVLAAAACVAVNVHRREPFLAALGGGGLAGFLASTLSSARVEGELYSYLTLPATAVGFLLVLSVVATCARLVLPVVHGRWVVRAAWAVVVVASAALVGATLTSDPTESLYAARSSGAGAEATVERLLDRLVGIDSVRVEIADQAAWPAAALIANQAERAGLDVTTSDDWHFMFGEQRESSGCEGAVVHVGSAATLADGGLGEVVGDVGGTSVAVDTGTPGC